MWQTILIDMTNGRTTSIFPPATTNANAEASGEEKHQ